MAEDTQLKADWWRDKDAEIVGERIIILAAHSANSRVDRPSPGAKSLRRMAKRFVETRYIYREAVDGAGEYGHMAEPVACPRLSRRFKIKSGYGIAIEAKAFTRLSRRCPQRYDDDHRRRAIAPAVERRARLTASSGLLIRAYFFGFALCSGSSAYRGRRLSEP